MSSKEFRHIVRMAGTDIDGSKKFVHGLAKIKGVGINLASAITRAANIRPDARIGLLSEEELGKVEDIIKDPSKHNLPARLFNRRKDLETGRDLHLIGADLALRTKMDIDFMKDIKTWKGIRHSLGLKVRGQRTRTTGRTGKTVGVRKKAAIEAARATAAAERRKEEKKE